MKNILKSVVKGCIDASFLWVPLITSAIFVGALYGFVFATSSDIQILLAVETTYGGDLDSTQVAAANTTISGIINWLSIASSYLLIIPFVYSLVRLCTAYAKTNLIEHRWFTVMFISGWILLLNMFSQSIVRQVLATI